MSGQVVMVATGKGKPPTGDGAWKAEGYPDGIPGTDPTPPPADPTVYGSTLIGQSYDAYKKLGTTQAAYDAVEGDTTYQGRSGGAVTRRYSSGNIGTWADVITHSGNKPMIYSWKNFDLGGTGATQLRAFLDSKPDTSHHCYLCYFHEPDGDVNGNQGGIPGATFQDRFEWYCDRQIAIRAVLDEVAYADRTDISFGPIWTRPAMNFATAASKRWPVYYDYVGPDTWDWMGGDFYQPAWKDTAKRYISIPDWIGPFLDMADVTEKNWLVGEFGSPLPTNTLGQTLAQQHSERAQWLSDLMDAAISDGRCEAMAYWRHPKLTDNTDPPSDPFTSLMFTPTGYTTLTDDDTTNDMFAQKCDESIAAANRTIPRFS